MTYKTQSANMVSRARRQVTGSTSNTVIDEDAFGGSEEEKYQALVLEKKELEIELSNIKQSITRAKTQAFHNKNYISPQSWKKLNDRSLALRQRVLVIEKEIAPLKIAIKARSVATTVQYDKEFSDYFLAAAKEMLAGPVYDRVATAAIHRMRGAAERDN